MNKNKKVIIVIAILIAITIIVIILSFRNNEKIFDSFINEISTNIIDKLDYEAVSGDVELDIKVTSLFNENLIFDTNYNGNYQIDLTKGFINIDGNIVYKDDEIDNNIYIKDSKILILVDDIYDKYVSFDADYLYFLKYFKESKQMVSIICDKVSSILTSKNYKYSDTKINDETVNKIQIKLTKNDYSKLRKKLINNKTFIKNLSEYKMLTKEDTIKFLENYEFDDYKLSIYTSKDANEYLGFEFNTNDKKIIIKNKEEKYFFDYYLNGGITYSGYIKMEDDKISKINFKDIIYQLNFDIDLLKNNITYNKDIQEETINYKEIINYVELTDKDKKIMKKNNIVKKIYNNYLKRLDIDTSGGAFNDMDL